LNDSNSHLLGGINDENCKFYIDHGASHVIVTSYVFRDGNIDIDRLNKLKSIVGKEHLVLDLSCRKKAEDGKFYVMTDRWQRFTNTSLR
jgi:phosphoribosylformimino-5-aminoimidazole carboxamide ribotide isomerase